MKTITHILLTVLVLTSISSFGQTDKTTTARIVPAKNFIFVATTALPTANADINNVLTKLNNQGGAGTINLTGSNYDLRITPDSVVAYLPFYGRAFTGTMDPNDSGTKFTSKKFEYTSAKGKKGGWVITIDPKDVKDGQRMTLNVTESGYASLFVMNNNRQPISFNGYIAEPKEKK